MRGFRERFARKNLVQYVTFFAFAIVAFSQQRTRETRQLFARDLYVRGADGCGVCVVKRVNGNGDLSGNGRNRCKAAAS